MLKGLIRIFASISLCGLIFIANLAYAANHYVSPSGTASWNNSTNVNSPSSLSTAFENATAGDTVFLKGGSYSISSSLTTSNNGTANSPVRLVAVSGEIPLITANGIDSLYIENTYWVINGIHFQSTNMPDHDHAIINVGYNYDADHVTIENCNLNLLSRQGQDNISCIRLQANRSNYAYIIGNDLQGTDYNEVYGSYGIQYLGGTNIGTKILNNRIHNVSLGVYVKHANSDTASTSAEIAYNYFYDCYYSFYGNPTYINFHDNLLSKCGINLGSNGGGPQGKCDTINHNTFFDSGLTLENPSEGPVTYCKITNNIFMAQVGLSIWSSGSQAPHYSTLDHNLYITGSAFLEYGNNFSLSTWKNHYGGDAHSIAGSPTFTGGPNPSSISGFALANGSLGKNAASDGSDFGANIALTCSGTQPNINTVITPVSGLRIVN